MRVRGQHVQIESREDAPEALVPTKRAFHLVPAPVHLPVVLPGVQVAALRRRDGDEAEVEHQLTGLVVLVGAIHHQRRATRRLPHLR